MSTIDLTKYGITDVKEIVHNPSYEVLFAEETNPALEGYEKGQLTELDTVNVMTGIYTGRSPKDKFFVKNEASEDTVWWTSEEYKNDNKPCSEEAYFQEAGRGGRDGKRSFAVTIWNSSDTKRLRQIATVSFPSLDYIEDIYHKVHIFYDIPYDTGAGRQLKFDLDAFCKHFNLQKQAAYYSIIYIERTGHWTMSEDVDISTKIQISVSRNELYDVEFPDPKMVRLLDILMRKYTGIFSYPVPIDEEYVAGLLDVQVPMLRQLLYKLSLEHVIRYIPCDHATVIYLHHERLRPKNVNLDPARYDLLKNSAMERMQKMIDYISQEDTCRSSYLLEYFGQKDSSDCGTCDVCRARNAKSAKSSDFADEIIAYVNGEMSGTYSLDDVLRRFSGHAAGASQDYIAVLRRLIDQGSIPPPQA